jgi:hypothetical protein
MSDKADRGLKERLLAGERIKVQGRYTAKRFHLGIVEAPLGVKFLCAFDEQGRRVRGSAQAEAWLMGVRLATLDACHPVGKF